MTEKCFAAVDLGAESGRVVLGRLERDQLTLEEAARFPNVPVHVAGGVYWDVLRLFGDVIDGLGKVSRRSVPASVGVDTWGVDFGLLDRNGSLLGNPRHYRDPHTDGAMDRVFTEIPKARVFELTGVQFLRFNTLYQLHAMARAGAAALEVADTLLMMPDLFHFWLAGERVSEHTIASTTQAYDAGAGRWVFELFERLGLPRRILPTVVAPGTDLGRLRAEVAEQTGMAATRVIAPACHDSGSAVAAVPASQHDYAYISSGTWSAMGVVLPAPIVNDQSLDLGFTNEGGVDGTIRLLKNINGLWLVQQCRSSWARSGDALDYSQLTALAEQAGPLGSVVDPDHPSLLCPDDMPRALRELCAATGQRVPADRGQILRVALESLACKYRQTLEQLEALTRTRLAVIHVVGGGSRNRLLCQLTADVTARPVLSGPTETSALGNVLAQAIGCGECRDWAEARELVLRSFPPFRYEPDPSSDWELTYAQFLRVAQP